MQYMEALWLAGCKVFMRRHFRCIFWGLGFGLLDLSFKLRVVLRSGTPVRKGVSHRVATFTLGRIHSIYAQLMHFSVNWKAFCV